MKMRIIPSLTILACLALTACSTVREGVIVQKRFRVEEPEVYGLYEFSFRCEPSVYWVQVEGKDVKGRERIRNIILFRHDWQALRVGDHWSREKGFSPGEGEK
jgi:hypothetical protein